ncbi:class I SAM-dependent DNA methyltransferase [Pseudomonadota bacterium]
MSDSWDEYADEWDSDESAIIFADKAFSSLNSVVDYEKPTVFDFGCGTGLLTERLSSVSNRVVALDSSEKMIAVLNHKRLPNVSTLALDLSTESIKENPELQLKFDLVVASSVCGFLPDYDTTLKVIKSLLADKGTFIQWDWLASTEGADFGLTESRVKSALMNAGFNNISINQPFSMESSDCFRKVLMAVASS